MIDWWQAVCLALLQGVTEFLPISSSAHLLLPSLLLGWRDQGLAFDVAVHVGTLLAVLWYYRQDLGVLTLGFWSAVVERRWNPGARELLQLAIASLPVVIVGFLMRNHMESMRTIPVLIGTTIGFGLLLGLADWTAQRRGPGARELPGYGSSLLIGLAQALAIVPGTSRSGVTLTAGLFLGLDRKSAARFAFLLSIPAIAGAGFLKGVELASGPAPARWDLLALATLVAALSAYSCIAVFLRILGRIGLQPFVFYRLLLGVALIALWWR